MQVTYEAHPNYEQIATFHDDDFHCIVAIHSTRLGPAFGGCRLKPYLTHADAMVDVLRLAKAMTYKCSLADLNFGGGKMVVIADHPTRDILLKIGEVLNQFAGSFITGEDIGTTPDDIAVVNEVTPYVARIDGSAMTARGVLSAMLAAALYHKEWGDSLDGVAIWVQGLGKVGMPLTYMLSQHDHPNIYVSDLRTDLVSQACSLPGVYSLTENDKKFISIYAPCAMGQVVHPGNVHTLRHSIICGAANNQLLDDSYAEVLYKNDVLYVPDWLANAGGVIVGACEADGPYDKTRAETMTDDIGQRLIRVLEMADKEGIPPLHAAKRLAEVRLL